MNLSGGFGSSVAEIMASRGCKAKLLRIGIADMFCREVGDQHHLRCVCGIDSETIVRRIQEELA